MEGNEATQDVMAPSSATPCSRRKKLTEDSQTDALASTVTKYFNAKMEKKTPTTDSNEIAYAQKMSNVVYEMLKVLPLQEQYLASKGIINAILKHHKIDM